MAVKKGKVSFIPALYPAKCSNSNPVAGPVVTDNGNFIIDAPFEREHMVDPYIVSRVFFLLGMEKAYITLVFRLWLGSRC